MGDLAGEGEMRVGDYIPYILSVRVEKLGKHSGIVRGRGTLV